MATKTFERNLSGKSTYICGVCGKRTRDTGLGEGGLELCAYDFELAGLENSLSDGHIDQATFVLSKLDLDKQYKRGEFAPKSKTVKTDEVDTAATAALDALLRGAAKPAKKSSKKAAKPVVEETDDTTTEADGARTCRVRLFGKTLTIRFSADSDEVLSGKSYSELRDAARQYIFDCVTSISDAEQHAQVRVVNVEVK